MTISSQKIGFIAISFIVALFLVSQIAFGYPITGNAIKTEKVKVNAGIVPDSFFYGLDVALDNINLALTFDQAEKANKALNIARERLMEVREMVDQNKVKAAQAAQSEHTNTLGIVQNSVRNIKEDNSTEEIEKEIEIEKELEEHETEIEQIRGELKVKIEVEGKLTTDKKTLIDSVLTNLQNKTGEVEIEIENEKNKTKIEIEKETGKTEKQVEGEIEELEEKTGLKGIRKEKAWDKIKDAEEEINETVEELAESNITDINITSALNILSQAKNTYHIKNYKKAIKLAKQAEIQIENYKEQFEEDLEEKGEREIEVEIKGNKTKVDVEIAGVKAEFILDTTNKNEIISEIASRTSVSKKEIENIMELEREKPEEKIEIEVEIEKQITKIKTEINKEENKFTLNTTNKRGIISEIISKTGLNREQVEKNVEVEIEKEISRRETEKEDSETEEQENEAGRESNETEEDEEVNESAEKNKTEEMGENQNNTGNQEEE